jgi:hypothetical protein
LISVVIPTIKGREHHLERCIDAYQQRTEDFEFIFEVDHRTCGSAWLAGGTKALGDYIHFTADDLEPHPGWWEAAVRCIDSGCLPCPRILRPDGSLESCGQWGTETDEGTETDIARVPFLSRQMWERGAWVLPAHYYTDNWIATRGRQLGIPTVVCRDYGFTHYYASEGRLQTMDADLEVFKAAV